MTPHFMPYFGSIFFANMGGGGGQNSFQYGSMNLPYLGEFFFQKNSRRLELSISKNTPHGRWGQGPGRVDPMFPAGLAFPVPEIL